LTITAKYCIAQDTEMPSQWTKSDPRNDIECIDHITQSDKYLYRRGKWQDHL
jgi:hypothetical protein